MCLCSLLQSLLKQALILAKVLASAIGKIISMSLALGPVTRFMTRSLHTILNSRSSWCTQLRLSAEVKQELSSWLASNSQFNGQDLWPKPSAVIQMLAAQAMVGIPLSMVAKLPMGNGTRKRPSRAPHGVNLGQSEWFWNLLSHSYKMKGSTGLQITKMLHRLFCMGVESLLYSKKPWQFSNNKK